MHPPGSRTIIVGILILTFAIPIIAYPFMPEPMASHWGLSGEANGYLPKFWGLFLVPFISAGLALLFLIIPRIDPLKKNYPQFRPAYDLFVVVILLFLLYLSVLVILWNLGMKFSMTQVLAPAFGALLYTCGVLIGNAKRNWFVGIRTPWTLSSERVWEKTHALGGKLFRAAGLLALLGAVLPGIAWLLFIAPVLLISVYLVVYSYLEYQKEEAGAGAAQA